RERGPARALRQGGLGRGGEHARSAAHALRALDGRVRQDRAGRQAQAAVNLYKGAGGMVVLPKTVFLDRADGGHLIVNPPRDVWEQSELANVEFMHWCILVGAIGRSMIDVLPQLAGGCVNYFEAGNWALNDAAPPRGPKTARDHRRVHMHVFGRSRDANHPSWRWG